MNFTIDFKNISHKLINVPSAKNQDRSFNLELFDGYIKVYSVFDGHGEDGTKYSELTRDFIKENLVNNSKKLLEENIEVFLNIMIEELNNFIINNFSKYFGGTTVSIIIIRNNLDIWCLNIGDSDCILFSDKEIKKLNSNHSPDNLDERLRIENKELEFIYAPRNRFSPYIKYFEYKNNRWIKNEYDKIYYKNVKNEIATYVKYKNLFLAMTRSIGDLELQKAGITYQPSINKYNFPDDDKFYIIIGSDGFWDCWKNEEIYKIIQNENEVEKFYNTHLLKELELFGEKYDDSILYIIEIN